MMKRWPFLAPLVILVASQLAYVVSTMSNLAHPTWAPTATIRMELWKGLTRGHPSLTLESDPERSIRGALDAWAGSSSLGLTLATGSPVPEARLDGHNLITIADTPSNRSFVGGASLAMTKYWQSGSTIIESDIVINPDYQFSSLENGGGWSLERVVMHEFGHSIGLAHSIDRSAAMHFQGGNFVHDFEHLAWDDVAALNTIFPLPGMDLITGAISGRVSMRGRAVFGAFVVAVDEDGVLAASGLSLPDGSYRIERLPAGHYTLYVEPLDGPMTPSQLYMGLPTASMTTGFRPQFYKGSMEPLVEVKADGSAWADFEVVSADSNLDPMWTRIDTDPNQSGGFTVLTTVAQAGTGPHVAVAGTGVASMSDQSGVFFLGPHLTTGTVSRTHRSASGVDFKWYPLEVSEQAPRGPHSIFVRNASELGVLTGALQIDSLFRHSNPFAQFIHIAGLAGSRVLLINTNLNYDSVGRLASLKDTGERQALEMVDDGQPMTPGADFRVPPGGSFMAATKGDLDFLGSLRADTSEAALGAVLIDTSVGSASFLASQPLHYFVAPFEITGAGAGANTGLALTNLDKRTARIHVQVQDANGIPQSSAILELPGEGHLSKYITEIAPGLPPDLVGTLAVTANRQIGATVIRTADKAFTTFPAIGNRTARRSFFAQFAHGGRISSELLLVNPSPRLTAQNVEITVHAADSAVELDGERLTAGHRSVRIPPLGLARLRTTGSGSWEGYVELASDLPVSGLTLFQSPAFGTAGVGESVPGRRLVLPLLRRLSAGEDTGVALLNAESRTVTLSLVARDQQGDTEATKSLSLDPRQQLTGFTDETPFNLGLSADFEGSLWIEADGDVAATVMRLSPNGLATLPALPLEDR